MKHWDAVLPDQIYHLHYEALIENPEEEIKGLLRYCQLPWDDRFRTFYASDRVVRTPSLFQVRQPIYSGSGNRWKPYRSYLPELLDALNVT